MSTEEDKIKRSTRLHKEEAAIAKQVKIAKAHGMRVKEPHVFVKHHAVDELNLPSNPRKTLKEKTVQEKRFEQTEGWDD